MSKKKIPTFDKYVKKLISDLPLEKQEKQELEEEWLQHLYDHFHSLLKKDFTEDDAIQTSLEQFGDSKTLRNEIRQVYPSALNQHIKKEIVIAFLCLLASVIGPIMLIGSHFRIYFVTAPVYSLLLAYFIYRYIVKRQTFWVFSIIGTAVFYLYFLQLLPQISGADALTPTLYLYHIFTLDWARLTGVNGLFEFVTLHMMWYVVIAIQFFRSTYRPLWERICQASFQYWAMIFIGCVIARFQSSAEWATLTLNVFLLYGFLQQITSIQMILIMKEKVRRLFKREVI